MNTIDTDANQDADPSAALDSAPAPDANADANPADSSPADEQDAKKTLLEVVQDALPKDEEPGPAAEDGSPSNPEPEAGSEPTSEGAAQQDEGANEGESEEKPPPFHEHPAWKRQIEKRELAEKELANLKPQAEEFSKIDGFMRANNLSSDEAAQGWHIMAALKNDPATAYKELKPIVEKLAQQVGDVVPGDLQEKVEKGILDDDTARRLAQSEAQAKLLEQQMQFQKQQQDAFSAHALSAQMSDAAVKWEQDQKSSDPAYGSKQKLVENAALVLKNANPPRTVQDAINILNQAKAQVDEQVKAFLPAKQPISKPPASDSSVNTGGATEQPKTMLEAVQRALAASGAA